MVSCPLLWRNACQPHSQHALYHTASNRSPGDTSPRHGHPPKRRREIGPCEKRSSRAALGELDAELAPLLRIIALGHLDNLLSDRRLNRDPIALLKLQLHSLQMLGFPMQAHESADEQFCSLLAR